MNDRLYIGAVTTGEDGGMNIVNGATDLYAYVFETTWEVTTNPVTQVLEVPLNYQKGSADTDDNTVPLQWNPWTDDPTVTARSYPSPVLSALEFTDRGDLILGFMDRGGDQWGVENLSDYTGTRDFEYALSGDILIAGTDGNRFTLESNGSFTSLGVTYSSPGAGNNQGPGGGEFFYQEAFIGHQETATGGLTVLPGSGEVMASVMDPLQYASGGVTRFSTSNGQRSPDNDAAYELYLGRAPFFSKANGLGGIRLLCGLPPIELGNYVWEDIDMDGIQDACEPPVAGLFVTLIDQATGMVIDVDTTDSNGNYYFTDEEGVELDSSYTIVFGYNSAAATQQYDPASGEVLIDGTVYSFTTPQSVEGNNPDQNDSDAVVMAISGIGDFPSTSISNVQQTNHDLDAGLVGDASLSLGSTVFTDLNNNGLQDAGDTGIPGVLVIVYAEGGDGTADGADDTPVVTGADGIVGTADDAFGPDGISGNADDGQPGMLTDANGDYFFAGLAMGDYYVEIPAGAFGAGEALENLPLSSNTSSSTFAGETDPDDNADSDDDGTQAGGSATAITSGIISLAAGEEPVDGTGATDEAGQGNAQDNAPDYVDADGNMTLDFGLFAPVTVGDFTFVDVDGDGLQGGPDDVPLENVTVTIIDVNTGQPVAVDADGNPYVATQMTTNTGAYLFTNLPPGNYQVTFDLGSVTDGELYDFTTPNAGNDTDDSDASPAAPMDDVASSGPTGELTSGQSDLTLDAGVVCAVIVELAEPFAICSSQQVDLTQNITVSPASLAATAVFTSSGDGDFLDAGGAVLTSGTTFGTAVTYRPGTADAARGMVTITLTTEDPAGPCDPASDSVTVEILGVDCGSFFWDGR